MRFVGVSQLAAREASELRSLVHEKSTKIFSPPRGKILENIDGPLLIIKNNYGPLCLSLI